MRLPSSQIAKSLLLSVFCASVVLLSGCPGEVPQPADPSSESDEISAFTDGQIGDRVLSGRHFGLQMSDPRA